MKIFVPVNRFIAYLKFSVKSEAKGSDETVDDVDVEMKKDADVEAGE